jgi:predicted metalloprotease
MIWKGRRRSDNIEDRRRVPAKGVAAGGIGTLVLVLAIYLLGGDPTVLLDSVQHTTSDDTSHYQETSKEKELAEFVSVVLADTEDVWRDTFNREGKHYRMPKLVIFSGTVDSACGRAGKSTGPFYCPADESVYIDLSFHDDLRHRFGAPGDFAMAYVIAHEVGHHVQNLTGTMERVMSLRARLGEREFNPYLVRLELQADYYAGVWAHHAERMKLLEEGDIEEALNAASAVGDDRIQQRAQGYVVPDSFTHGTSEQRKSWFYRGFTSGTLEDGDTFSAGDL